MNCYLKVNDNKTLSVVNGNINFLGEHNAESIVFLFPSILNEFDIPTSTIMLNLVNSTGVGNVYTLTQDTELYKEFLVYKFAITDQFTTTANSYTCWLTITSSTGKIMKTMDYNFSVVSKLTTSSIIPTAQMDLVDDLMIRVTALEEASGGVSIIDDITPSTSKVYSSSKIDTTYAKITTTDELLILNRNKSIGIVKFPTTTDNGDGSITIDTDGIVNFSKIANGDDNYYRYNMINSATLVFFIQYGSQSYIKITI